MRIKVLALCIFMMLTLIRSAYSDDNHLYTEANESAGIVLNVSYEIDLELNIVKYTFLSISNSKIDFGMKNIINTLSIQSIHEMSYI